MNIMLLTVSTLAATADQRHELAGPRGGRLLEKTDPKAEFFLEKDRTATITFYDAKLKPVSAAEQTASIVANTKEGRKTVEFEKKGDVLASKGKLPDGEAYPVVLQLRMKADAKPQNHRFNLDTSTCGGCKRVEYACTCHD